MQEITSITAVSNILEDALSRVNLREDLGVLLQNVVDVVDPVQDDYSFVRTSFAITVRNLFISRIAAAPW